MATGVEFVFQNLQTALAGAAAVASIPFVQAMDRQSALLATGRVPGGGSYNQPLTSVTGNIALLGNIANLGYAKNGCFHKTTASNTPVVIDLTNLATNATSTAGDLTFASVQLIIAFNLSGVDGVAGADMTLGATAANSARLFGVLVATPITVPFSSPHQLNSFTPLAVDGTHKNITLTPSAGGNFTLVVCGA